MAFDHLIPQLEPGDLVKHSLGIPAMDGYWFVVGKARTSMTGGVPEFPCARLRSRLDQDQSQYFETEWLDARFLRRAHVVAEFVYDNSFDK